LFPPMLEAAKRLLADDPALRFATTGATEVLTETLRAMTSEAGLSDQVQVGGASSYAIMQSAGVGVVASGTATLEAACLGLPYCLTYKVAWLTAVVARRVMSVDYLGIVNVLADREVVRELLQEDATGEGMYAELKRLLTDTEAKDSLRSELSEVVAMLGAGGAHEGAANAVASAFASTS